ncbi:MAG: D-alanine--D-alanine ligase [Planctomycetota bacterium]
MRIGLVYDLRTAYLAEGYSAEDVAEFDSEATVAAIEGALRANGHAVERVGHGRALAAQLAAGGRFDLVFSIAEGLRGRSREAQVPALCELFGQPYAFSDPLVCAVTLDKAVAKRLAAAAGVHTPRFAVVRTAADVDAIDLAYPLFAKPVAEGTGKGIGADARVVDQAGLRRVCGRLLERYRQPVLVEEYLPGREFTTGILGTGAEARVLGTMEVIVKPDAPAPDYNFDVKEQSETFVDCPPLAAGALRDAVAALALQAYRALECRDTGRVDIRLDRAGQPAFIEVNPIPGLHPTHSDLPTIATQAGMPYNALIGAIVASARTRIERDRI